MKHCIQKHNMYRENCTAQPLMQHFIWVLKLLPNYSDRYLTQYIQTIEVDIRTSRQ